MVHPQHIIEACFRFASSVMNVVGEMKRTVFRLKLIMNGCFIYFRLNPIMSCAKPFSLSVIRWRMRVNSQTETYSITVNKAIRMIQNQYRDGITLEEMAVISAYYARVPKFSF